MRAVFQTLFFIRGRPALFHEAQPLTRLDCGGYPHRHPQKTQPRSPPPRTPLTHRVGASCEVREVRASVPRPFLPQEQAPEKTDLDRLRKAKTLSDLFT